MTHIKHYSHAQLREEREARLSQPWPAPDAELAELGQALQRASGTQDLIEVRGEAPRLWVIGGRPTWARLTEVRRTEVRATEGQCRWWPRRHQQTLLVSGNEWWSVEPWISGEMQVEGQRIHTLDTPRGWETTDVPRPTLDDPYGGLILEGDPARLHALGLLILLGEAFVCDMDPSGLERLYYSPDPDCPGAWLLTRVDTLDWVSGQCDRPRLVGDITLRSAEERLALGTECLNLARTEEISSTQRMTRAALRWTVSRG